MNLHHYQAASLKLFEDPSLNKVWVYSKEGISPSPKPVCQCAAEENFQSETLEKFQQKTETAAARAFQSNGPWDERERNAVVEWVALHIIRSKRSHDQLFSSAEDYNREFFDEFREEVLITRKFTFYPPIIARPGCFFITSDQPIVEIYGSLSDKEMARCFAKSPDVMISLGLQPGPPEFALTVEDYFNAMIWANAHEFVFSHRKDMPVAKLQQIAEEFEMFPVEKSITFQGWLSRQDLEHMDALQAREQRAARECK